MKQWPLEDLLIIISFFWGGKSIVHYFLLVPEITHRDFFSSEKEQDHNSEVNNRIYYWFLFGNRTKWSPIVFVKVVQKKGYAVGCEIVWVHVRGESVEVVYLFCFFPIILAACATSHTALHIGTF